MPEGVYLLPNYDEYTVAYRERDLFYDPPRAWAFDQREAVPFGNVIVVDGQVAGVWRRTLRPGRVVVEVGWYIEPTAAQRQAVAPAAERYAAFIGLPLELLTRSAA
jgi:hypothetical protein